MAPGDGDATEAKRAIRERVRGRLSELTPSEQARLSALASGHLIERYGEKKPVMGYLALPGEIDPGGAMALWRSRGVVVCAPRVDWETRQMTAAALSGDRRDLALTRHGLLEPGPKAQTVPIGELGAVIVPGIAFTSDGKRLGRGGGFYDRFLSRLSGGTLRIGLVFSCQMVDELPVESHDEGVDIVITEDGPVR